MNDKARLRIYTVTSIYIKDVMNSDGEVVGQTLAHNRCRMVGFYADIQTAMKCVEEDWAGFDEAGYYNYIVIERMVEGLYNLHGLDLNDESQGEWWYKHSYDNGKWVACERPKSLRVTINFGLG